MKAAFAVHAARRSPLSRHATEPQTVAAERTQNGLRVGRPCQLAHATQTAARPSPVSLIARRGQDPIFTTLTVKKL